MAEIPDILKLNNPVGFTTYSLAWGCESPGPMMVPVKIKLPTKQQYMAATSCNCRACQSDGDE